MWVILIQNGWNNVDVCNPKRLIFFAEATWSIHCNIKCLSVAWLSVNFLFSIFKYIFTFFPFTNTIYRSIDICVCLHVAINWVTCLQLYLHVQISFNCNYNCNCFFKWHFFSLNLLNSTAVSKFLMTKSFKDMNFVATTIVAWTFQPSKHQQEAE